MSVELLTKLTVPGEEASPATATIILKRILCVEMSLSAHRLP